MYALCPGRGKVTPRTLSLAPSPQSSVPGQLGQQEVGCLTGPGRGRGTWAPGREGGGFHSGVVTGLALPLTLNAFVGL